ncbi:tetratricopeptide repeat protein [Streptomyces sp. SBT349]|uniref:tetratricopeptide repeat protein n=1 Tax=Streptomyces sp. SBT349 TaxID=1580539 RepID=UPI00066B0495|nr:tetratricopeptide repeat protein [Streptomyces sp. SBT349]
MTKTLSGLFGARRRNAGRQEELLARAVRAGADYLASLDAKPDTRRVRLAAATGALTTARPAAAPETFDTLLTAGNRALDAGGAAELRLALALADTAVELRGRSKGAWKLRGLILEALGRDDEAVAAYDRHLDLRHSGTESQDIVLRQDVLKEIRACLEEAARLVRAEPGSPLDRPPHQAAPEVRTAFADHIKARLAHLDATGTTTTPDPETRRLIGLYATYRRLTAEGRMGDPLLGDATPLGAAGLRSLLTGRTVCLVANGDAVAASAHGEGIDAYDVVIRCDSYRIAPRGTGERTDVHAVTLRGPTPWDGPRWTQSVQTRLVFGDPADAWRRSLRRRLAPGAQSRVGDATLRRPLHDPALVGDGDWPRGGSTAFTVLRLLDFLDVTPRIDLIGLGLPGQLRPEEHAWVTARAPKQNSTEMRIALR